MCNIVHQQSEAEISIAYRVAVDLYDAIMQSHQFIDETDKSILRVDREIAKSMSHSSAPLLY